MYLKSVCKKVLLVFLMYACCSIVVAQETAYDLKCDEDSLLREIDLPLVEIWTVDGEEPSGEHITAPDDFWGVTLINNEYVYLVDGVATITVKKIAD